MPLSESRIEELATALYEAERERRPIPPLTEKYPQMTPEEAYAVQLKNIRRKLAQGRRVVGKKVGLTSRAMQQMLGVDQPDYGHLLDDMAVADGGVVALDRLVQPKVEAEIAFILKRDLQGPGLTVEDVMAATESLAPAIEIIDSRIRNWQIKLADTIADNASSGLFVLGEQRTPVDTVDLRLVGMVLSRNGEVALTGAGAAVLGHPAVAVTWLANKLAEFGITLKAGEVILSGSLSAALGVSAGDKMRAEFAHLGSVSVTFA